LKENKKALLRVLFKKMRYTTYCVYYSIETIGKQYGEEKK